MLVLFIVSLENSVKCGSGRATVKPTRVKPDLLRNAEQRDVSARESTAE